MKQQALPFSTEDNRRTILDLTRKKNEYIEAGLLVDEHDADAKPKNQTSLISAYFLL